MTTESRRATASLDHARHIDAVTVQDGPAESPPILVLMIRTHYPYRSVVVNLLNVEAYMGLGYLIVARDPFSMDAWRAWRRAYPEAV